MKLSVGGWYWPPLRARKRGERDRHLQRKQRKRGRKGKNTLVYFCSIASRINYNARSITMQKTRETTKTGA